MPRLKIQLFLLGFATAIFSNHVNAETIEQIAERLLKQTPEVAFENAVSRKDFRLLTIPFCGHVTPGFNFLSYKGPKLEENNFGLYCDSLLGKEGFRALQKLKKWVEKYNSLMFNQINQGE